MNQMCPTTYYMAFAKLPSAVDGHVFTASAREPGCEDEIIRVRWIKRSDDTFATATTYSESVVIGLTNKALQNLLGEDFVCPLYSKAIGGWEALRAHYDLFCEAKTLMANATK